MTRRSMPRQKPGLSKQDYTTDRRLILAVLARLDISNFSFDFAATKRNSQAERYFTKRDNALVQPWESVLDALSLHGDPWGWLNPPYDNIDPWAERCARLRALGRQIAFLTPASVGSNWFRDHVDRKALVLMLNGRLAFIPSQPKALYPKDCILSIYSPAIAPGYQVWDWRKNIQTDSP